MFESSSYSGTHRPLIAYAFLAQTSHNDGDLLTGLIPIFSPLVKEREGEQFDPSEFSEALARTYGISISPWATEELAPRLERAGLLIKSNITEKFIAYRYAITEQSFAGISEAEIRYLIDNFLEFTKKRLSLLNTKIDDYQNLENAFLDHLVTTNFYHIQQKPDRSKEDKKTPTTISLPKNEAQKKWEEEVAYEGTIDVLIASYIYYIQESKTELYELLMKIANGALIAEVVLNFREPDAGVSLEGLTVILDAPFIMAALDLCEEESFQYAKELIDKLVQHKATVATLAHYCEEIKDNIDYAIERFERGGRDKATDRRLSDKTFMAYAREVRFKPRETVAEQNIKVIDFSPTETSYQYFSEADEKEYFLVLGAYHNRKAQHRDSSSLATTIRLRRGKVASFSQIEKCGYIFVTNNPWIPEKTIKYLTRKNLHHDGDVPPVISDRYLAGLIWVIFGGTAGDIGRLRLLANCAQALEARADVINKVHGFLQNANPEKAKRFLAAMTNERASHHLMQLSLGDSRLVTGGNYAEIYQEIENELESKHIKISEERIEEIRVRLENEKHAIAEAKDAEIQRALEEAEILRTQNLNTQAEVLTERTRVAELTGSLADAGKAILEFKNEQCRLITQHMRSAIEIKDRTEHRITVAASLLTALVAYLGISFAMDSILDRILVTSIPSLLSYILLWRNPDRIFKTYLDNLRDTEFNRLITDSGLNNVLLNVNLNWNEIIATQNQVLLGTEPDSFN